ncbi:NosR/NirI family protein [Oharaeibacter diazotrophicus]|uniref:NosR/NirI family nitrous oxide reductase transcriptional regulator n=1 Tax=Oharaeibacter diazotrophicus TaxID=1920512 RepID=A0A4R6RGL9_9HYPH|nr:NosR/NirI family protein [Oharaeibacter diazotrophicus]TDP85460.1 NosR/NirI family nitrous oxide reductase transcriptional regulator [Oharaeibacter diazotrophicus]BBE74430.1 putative electron transport protein YccM [Pleomorphomonas sp. SM30]GLS75874.1 FMN-binding protein [Oharaeibacter diazotrophicus]
MTERGSQGIGARLAGWCRRGIAAAVLAVAAVAAAPVVAAEPLVGHFLDRVAPTDLVPGADAFGPVDADATVPALKGGETIGRVFLTSDFVPTTGYSGKPIHVLVGVSPQAVITGVRLVKHSEPIVLVGIPEAKIRAVTEKYAGLDLKKAATTDGGGHDLEVVSGATVTVMVIDDTILRASLKVARMLKLPGVGADVAPAAAKRLDPAVDAVSDWTTLAGDGSLRRFTLDVGTVNRAFADLKDPRGAGRPEAGAETDAFVDVWVGLVSQPSIGRTLLGEAEYATLGRMLRPGDAAVLVAGAGRWSFKGSGYVRGGIFDRIQLIQGETSHRFRDKEHRRVVRLAAADAPAFADVDIFVVPKDAGFDPARPWRMQFLVQRPVGPIEKLFLTYDLDYSMPARYLADAPAAPAAEAAPSDPPAEAIAARDALWLRIWQAKKADVAILGVALAALTGIFFFQTFATRNARVFAAIRTGFLIFTLVFVGWHANAQLSVVNVLAVLQAFVSGFRWETFLMDPPIFVLWFAVAAALLFWARGAYCGWLCPFGALQELSNKVARLLRVPQVKLPWGLHERLWPVKYMIFLGLLGLSFYGLDVAERFAEIEPFKTAIILKFDRPWPYVLFALATLAPGLFVERFYCRYVCPLGGGLAIPARLHMFRWLKRYSECGHPCQVCAKDCPVEAIHPTGEINPNECISCLNCQVLYQSTEKCPVVIGKLRKRERFERQNGIALATHSGRPAPTQGAKAEPEAAQSA